MKRYKYLLITLLLFVSGIIQTNATSGQLKKASIVTCNGVTYGYHGDDNHWHVAKKSGSRYYATGDPIYSNPCSSSNDENESNNNTNNDNSNNESNNNDSSNNTGNTSDNDSKEENTTNNSSSSNNNTGNTDNKVETNTSNNSDTNKNETTNKKDDEKEEVEVIKSNDASLKEIFIDGKKFEILDNMIYSTLNDKINIEVSTNDTKATYEIKNNNNLVVGQNIVVIDVTAEDGTIHTYNINVTRERVISSDTGIKVIINNEEVIFEEYKAIVYISSSATNIDFNYELNDKNAKAELEKIEEIKSGDNIIIIKVIAEDGTEQDYELNIHKNTKSEEAISLLVVIIFYGGFGYVGYLIIKKIKKIFKNKNNIKITEE